MWFFFHYVVVLNLTFFYLLIYNLSLRLKMLQFLNMDSLDTQAFKVVVMKR